MSATNQARAIEIYPNPVIGKVPLSKLSGNETIQICSAFGQKVIEQTAGGKAEMVFDLASLHPGIYFIMIRGKGMVTKKIIKL